MSVSVQVDSTGFQRMIRELSRMSGKAFEEVLADQTKKVLETCVKYTPSAKLQEAIRRSQNHIKRKFNTYSGGRAGTVDQYIGSQVFTSAAKEDPRISITKAGTWYVKGGKFYMMKGRGQWAAKEGQNSSRFAATGPRWNAAMWAQFEREEADRVADLDLALKTAAKDVRISRGLCKASWLEIADDLGIVLKVPEFVRKARPANGKKYDNGAGRKITRTDAVFFEIENRMPTLVQKLDGRAILQRAISTRLKAFEIELRRGVFNDLVQRARRYPGIFVNPS